MEDKLLAPDSPLRDVFAKVRPKLSDLKGKSLEDKVGSVLGHPALGDVQIKECVPAKDMEKAMQLKAEGNTAFKVIVKSQKKSFLNNRVQICWLFHGGRPSWYNFLSYV